MGIAEAIKRFFTQKNESICYLCGKKLNDTEFESHLRKVHK
jgi:hypothetical protein